MGRRLIPLLFALGLVLLHLLLYGWLVGLEDQLDYGPYSLWLADHSLYPNDLFIQRLAAQPLNERTFSAGLVALWGPWQEAGALLLWLATGVGMVLALLALGRRLGGPVWLPYVLAAAVLLPLEAVYWDSTTLLGNNWQGDIAAHCLLLWAIVLALKHQLTGATFLLVVATLFHPLVGLLGMGWLWLSYLLTPGEEVGWGKRGKTLLRSALLYAAGAGWYVVALVLNKNNTGGLTDAEYYRLYYELRAAHHVLASTFGLRGWLLLALLVPVALWQLQGLLRRLVLVWVGLAVLYGVAVEGLHLIPVAQLQWYRLSPLIEVLGAAAALRWLCGRLPFLHQKIHLSPRLQVVVLSGAIAIAIVGLALLPPGSGRPYHFRADRVLDPEINIGLKMRAALPRTALVVHPIRFGGHKYYGRVSSYVEYKSFPRDRAGLAEWYRRLQLLYGVHMDSPHFWIQADQNYPRHALLVLRQLRREGVTHLVAPRGQLWPLPVVVENTRWVVYSL